MATATEVELCPKCHGPLRPEGFHPLDNAVGRPICPACWKATQPQRSERQVKSSPYSHLEATAFNKRLFEGWKKDMAERRAIQAETEAFRRELAAEKAAAEVARRRKFTFWERLSILITGLIPTTTSN